MTSHVSLCGCHDNQEITTFIFHIKFSMIVMLLFIIGGSCGFQGSLDEGKIIRNILTPKSAKLPVSVEIENQECKKLSVQICPKIIKMATILKFLAAIWNSVFFLLENVALKVQNTFKINQTRISRFLAYALAGVAIFTEYTA